MFRLNKTSQLVTITPDITVADYERLLNDEELTGGYRPASGTQERLDQCLAERIPNLYFLRYGGLEELCVGGIVQTQQGLHFRIKTAPRAATGSDLRRVVVGSRGLVGVFKEVTLRVFPLPEEWQWGLALFESKAKAVTAFRKMKGLFIRPLVAKIMGEEEGCGLLRSLNLPEEEKVVMAFKLAGLKGMVEAEKDCLARTFEGEKMFFYWPAQMAEVELLDEVILTKTLPDDFLRECAPLVGRDPKIPLPKAEGEFRRYFEENPC